MGKKHGTLAKAGKVRNQTPKVEKKQREKKLKLGRAKKRLQFKRRFAVTTQQKGKKRGPNSQMKSN